MLDSDEEETENLDTVDDLNPDTAAAITQNINFYKQKSAQY